MITKAITKDINGNTHIYRWKVYTHSEKVSCKCSICGKRINHTISFQFQEMPEREDWDEFEYRKQKWLSEEHTCSKCLKEQCKGEQKEIDRTEIDSIVDAIKDKELQMREIRKDINNHCGLISEKVKGRVCIYEGKEYVIDYVTYCDGFYMSGHKVDEKEPWYFTQTDFYISIGGSGYGGSKVVNAKLSEVTFTDEIFEERRERLKCSKQEKQ